MFFSEKAKPTAAQKAEKRHWRWQMCLPGRDGNRTWERKWILYNFVLFLFCLWFQINFYLFPNLFFFPMMLVSVAINILDQECLFTSSGIHASITIFGLLGPGSEGRAGASSEEEPFVPSAVQQSQLLHQELKWLPPAALWRRPTSELVSGMSIICNIWLACQSVPASPDNVLWGWKGSFTLKPL